MGYAPCPQELPYKRWQWPTCLHSWCVNWHGLCAEDRKYQNDLWKQITALLKHTSCPEYSLRKSGQLGTLGSEAVPSLAHNSVQWRHGKESSSVHIPMRNSLLVYPSECVWYSPSQCSGSQWRGRESGANSSGKGHWADTEKAWFTQTGAACSGLSQHWGRERNLEWWSESGFPCVPCQRVLFPEGTRQATYVLGGNHAVEW